MGGKPIDPLERIVPSWWSVGGRSPVLAVKIFAHPPYGPDDFHGMHPVSTPIRKDLTCVEVILSDGWHRYYGFQRAWIGSDLRMHVAPINENDEVVRKWPKPTE